MAARSRPRIYLKVRGGLRLLSSFCLTVLTLLRGGLKFAVASYRKGMNDEKHLCCRGFTGSYGHFL